jgi:hypothetical protein
MNRNIKKILKYSIFSPILLYIRCRDYYFAKYSPLNLVKHQYKSEMGDKLDIEQPSNLYEKINWIKFNTDTSIWSDLTDKLKVRKYIEEKGFKENLNSIYEVFYSVEEVRFDKLPKSFVLKTNNGCGTNIFVEDKEQTDLVKIKKKLAKWLKYDYGFYSAQPHYSKIDPCIIAENYLYQNKSNSLIDYKFYCFHGSPKYVFVYSDRTPGTHIVTRMLYDMNWRALPEKLDPHFTSRKEFDRPTSFEKMIEMVSRLSASFPFVRVDLYEIDNKPIFGEMTFTPGYDGGSSKAFLIELGSLIDISK